MRGTKRFRLLEDGFEYCGNRYGDREVKSLFFKETITIYKDAFGRNRGEGEKSEFAITLLGGQRIRLGHTDWLDWQRMRNVEKRRKLRADFQELARRTFQQRLAQYIHDDAPPGIHPFRYKAVSFVPPRSLICKGRHFHLDTYGFSRNGSTLTLKKRNPGMAEKILQELSLVPPPKIQAYDDPDVFFDMLTRVLGVIWPLKFSDLDHSSSR